jgi:enterochelin esterase family protein
MFFNDGWWYLDPDGDVRGGVVLDNLASDGSLPPMIGVFVDPGIVDVDGTPTKHRNAEYDAFDGTYADFLLEEVLPVVAARYRVADDPMMRGVCGGSSGGNAAMTAAWSRPDGIGRVIAFNPSFAQMPGGNPYPALLAAEAHRPTRVFLHAAHRDLHWDEPDRNWFAESLDTASALARASWDFRLVVGDGGHAPNHGGVLLPDALRWSWSGTVGA